MGQIIWSRPALQDVKAIGEYIGRDSIVRADLMVSRIIEASYRIAEFPLAGRPIPEVKRPNCREVLIGPYRVMYRILGDRIRITGVIHGARNWGNP